MTTPPPSSPQLVGFLRHYKWIILAALLLMAVTAGIEFAMGRLALGPDGRFGLWESDIWSSEQSQRVADPYTFSHTIHGMLFYGFLWLVARKMPVRYRFIGALLLEASWEILENSPLIINRYREVTISLDYYGDSILNSVSDYGACLGGVVLASRLPAWASCLLFAGLELASVIWMRDSLLLNMLMLACPI